MPSWVHSRIYIRGNEAARNEIVEANFDFHELNPCPEGVDPEVWAKEEYGTWQEASANIEDEDYKAQTCVITSTAWYPPTKFCKWLLNKYENLWIKIVWDSEDYDGGVIILECDENGGIKEKEFNWSEPSYNHDGEEQLKYL
jgi:hypothetical protein